MGVYKLSANSVKNGRTIYGSMLAGNTAFIPPSFESIATVTVGSGGTSSINFTSIPNTFTHLQIRGIARFSNTGTVGNDNVTATFNSDTGSNYDVHYLFGNGSSVDSDPLTNFSVMLTGKPSNASATAGVFGPVVIDILDYGNTNKYKTVRVLTGIDNNGSGTAFFNSNLWRNTNAITSISIAGGTYVQYSQFALYGIKGA